MWGFCFVKLFNGLLDNITTAFCLQSSKYTLIHGLKLGSGILWKKVQIIVFRLLYIGWAEQFSTNKEANLRSSFLIHSSNKTSPIGLFL